MNSCYAGIKNNITIFYFYSNFWFLNLSKNTLKSLLNASLGIGCTISIIHSEIRIYLILTSILLFYLILSSLVYTIECISQGCRLV